MRQMYTGSGLEQLQAMATQLDHERKIKVDYLPSPEQIHFVTSTTENGHCVSEIDLLGAKHPETGEDVAGLRVNDICHGQFANKLQIPKRFYDRLRFNLPGLLDENVNRLLRFNPPTLPPGEKREPWMIRTLGGTARAALSRHYARIDNYDIAAMILPTLREMDVEFRSLAITDKFMYIKAVTNLHAKIEGAKVGDVVRAGVYFRNSEVGYGKFIIAPFVETLICTNGMVTMRKGKGMMERVHLGPVVESNAHYHILSDETRRLKDQAFMAEVRDVTRAAVDEARFHELVAEMSQAAQSDPITDVKAGVAVLVQRADLTETEGGQILQHLAEGGDLSLWGLVSAVTRTAEDMESYDRATDLETLGGDLLAMPGSQWREIATATA